LTGLRFKSYGPVGGIYRMNGIYELYSRIPKINDWVVRVI
jgi:hypothetical protein